MSSEDESHIASRRRTLGSPLPPIPGRVVVVGVCAAGKSTLVTALRDLGYDAKTCAQEHSYVPDMWRRLSRPQVLIYLDASYEAVRARRDVPYGPERVEEQRQRVAHARACCAVYIDTTPLTIEQVLEAALQGLRRIMLD